MLRRTFIGLTAALMMSGAAFAAYPEKPISHRCGLCRRRPDGRHRTHRVGAYVKDARPADRR